MNNPEFASRLEQLLLRDKRIALKPNGTINVASAAKALTLGQPTLQRMLSGGSRLPSRPNAERIMSFLDVTFGQLVGTEPLPEDSESQAGPDPEFRLLPVISSVQVGSWADATEPGDADNYTPVNGTWSRYAFVLRVEGDSMMNTVGGLSIPHGAHVVVEPEEDAQHGDIVVAKLVTHEQATVKKLVIDPPDTYLMPLNPQYDKITIDEECRIVGVVKQLVIVIRR